MEGGKKKQSGRLEEEDLVYIIPESQNSVDLRSGKEDLECVK